jgi:hypothetical protein
VSGLLTVHAAVTWFMVGLIWTIQAVHYPLFRRVGRTGFVAYESAHTKRMGALLLVPAGVEVVTAAALVWVRPDAVGIWLVLAAGGLLAGVWIMTALLQAPLHRRLSTGYDDLALRRLVSSNWWRTAAWSARGVLVSAMLLA